MRSLLLGLLATWSTLACGCIFGSGFDKGCPVIAVFGNYTETGLQIVGTGSTPGILSGADNLFDGQPTTLCTIQWIDGTQTTSSKTAIQWQPVLNPFTGFSAITVGAVAVLNTSLPAGLKVEIHQGILTGTLLAHGTLQPDPYGGTSAWLVFDGGDITLSPGDHLLVVFWNDVGGTHPVTASEVFTVGDVFFGATASFNAQAAKIKRSSKQSWATSPKLRMSSTGVQWTVQQPQVRTMQVDLKTSPMAPTYLLNDPSLQYEVDIQSIVQQIMQSNVAGFIWWPTLDPSFYGTQDVNSVASNQLRARTAWLGQFASPPTITGTDMYFDTQFTAQESV